PSSSASRDLRTESAVSKFTAFPCGWRRRRQGSDRRTARRHIRGNGRSWRAGRASCTLSVSLLPQQLGETVADPHGRQDRTTEHDEGYQQREDGAEFLTGSVGGPVRQPLRAG